MKTVNCRVETELVVVDNVNSSDNQLIISVIFLSKTVSNFLNGNIFCFLLLL